MGERTSQDEQSYYICGQCDTQIFNLKTESPVIPCPECGWAHKDRKKYDVPGLIKFPIN